MGYRGNRFSITMRFIFFFLAYASEQMFKHVKINIDSVKVSEIDFYDNKEKKAKRAKIVLFRIEFGSL